MSKDTANGGNNYVMGAEVVSETGPVGLYVKDMSYTVPGGATPPVATPPVVTPPVVTPPVVTPPVVAGPATLTVTSLTEKAGKLTLVGDKEIGSAATMREFMDGKYLGTLTDGLKDGKFTMRIGEVATGSHTLALTLDGSGTGASYAFTKLASGAVVGSTVAATPPVVTPPVVTPPIVAPLPPVIVPPIVVSPVPTPAPTMSFVISSVAEDHGQLLAWGSKYTGTTNTVREFMDNNYLGVVQDRRADGKFGFDIKDVVTGAHSLTFTMDGSKLSATYGFTKTAAGTVTALTPATTTHVVLPILTHG